MFTALCEVGLLNGRSLCNVLIWCQTGGVAVRGCGSSGEFSVSEDGGILRLEGRNQHGVSSRPPGGCPPALVQTAPPHLMCGGKCL